VLANTMALSLEKSAVRILYWPAYFAMAVLSFLFFPFKVIGRENIPRKGNFVYASNHRSNLDPVLLGLTVTFRISYMAKEELFRNKFFRWVLMNFSSAFPLKREGADIGALKESIRRLKHDSPVVVFPQGTRILDDEALSEENAQEGVGFLVAKSGVPVVPAKIIDSDKVLPPGARWFRRRLITIVVGRPLYFSGKEPYRQIARTVMRSILSLSPDAAPKE
jgi:1-acyl-sn-glycerol-3-phosphate acyltransferase